MVNTRNIKAEITRKNITQAQLAEKLNISTRALNMKLNDIRSFSAEELYSIANYFEVDINIFFNDVVN